ncbi:hypothetical protein B0H16DRAFT_1683937, partial [Mycena metata]
MFGRGKPSNLEISLMMADLRDPNSTTRPCTQCQREVPKTQKLLTCEKCREKKKQQKARKKERDLAVQEGRGAGPNQGFSSATLQAVIAKQEQETAAKRAAARKPKAGANEDPKPSANASSSRSSMGMVLQAILDEHEREEQASKPAPKKRKVTKKATIEDELQEDLNTLSALLLFEMITKGASSSMAGTKGTKRKREEEEYEPNLPGTVYDAETSKKRMRGDMPMPRLEPIPGAYHAPAKKSVHKPVASSSKTASTSKTLPLRKETSNLPVTKVDSEAKP